MIEIVRLPADFVFLLSNRHVGRLNPEVIKDIEANGWREGEVVSLSLFPGHHPAVTNGNHRLRWLHENGRGSMKVPVEIKITAPGFE